MEKKLSEMSLEKLLICFCTLIFSVIVPFSTARGENSLMPLEILSHSNVKHSIATDETLSWITIDYSDNGGFSLWELNFEDRTLVSRKLPFPVTEEIRAYDITLCPHNTQYLYVVINREPESNPGSLLFYGIDENYDMRLLVTVDLAELDVWGWPMISDLFFSREAVYFRDCFGNSYKWSANNGSLLHLDHWIEDENEQGDYIYFIAGEDIDVMKWWRHQIRDLLLHQQITGQEIEVYHNSSIDSATRIWYHWQGQKDLIVISEGAVLSQPSINKYHISDKTGMISSTNGKPLYLDTKQGPANTVAFTDAGDYIAYITSETDDNNTAVIVVQSIIDGKSFTVFSEEQGGIIVSDTLIWRNMQ